MNHKIPIALTVFLISSVIYGQTDSAGIELNNTNFKDYNNYNFYWEPTGPVRIIDSGHLFCVIRTNIVMDNNSMPNDNIRVFLFRNLMDSTKDFATHVILSYLYHSNCCELINKYFGLKNSTLIWRKNEKEKWLKYWKEFLKLGE